MNEWKALLGRITLFSAAPSSQPSLSALEIYQRVWQSSPDNFQRSQNPLVPSVAQGNRGDLMAVCLVNPTRLDFNLAPGKGSQISQPTFQVIDNTRQLQAELLRIAQFVARGTVSDSINRVALSVQFISLRPSSVEANKTLSTVIPDQYRMTLTDEREFILQINRPRRSAAVDTIEMNVITKWSVERFQVVTMAIPVGGAPVVALPPSVTPEEFTAASVSFDINNVPTQARLTAEQQSSLLLEALSLTAQTQQDCGLNIDGFEHA